MKNLPTDLQSSFYAVVDMAHKKYGEYLPVTIEHELCNLADSIGLTFDDKRFDDKEDHEIHN